MQLPIKTRILQYAIEKDAEFTAADAYKDLKDEYPGERFFFLYTVEQYVDSFLGVSFLYATRTEFDDVGNLLIYCKVTDYGKSRQKYIH